VVSLCRSACKKYLIRGNLLRMRFELGDHVKPQTVLIV